MYSRLGMVYGCQWRFGMGMDVDPGVVFNAKRWDGRLENGRQHSHLFSIPSNSHVNVNLTHAHHEDSEISHETSMKSRIHLRIWKSSILNLNLDFANFWYFCHMFFFIFFPHFKKGVHLHVAQLAQGPRGRWTWSRWSWRGIPLFFYIFCLRKERINIWYNVGLIPSGYLT